MDKNKPKYKIHVLYICVDPSLGGSTSSLYNMIDGLRDYVDPIVLFSEKGVGYDFFISHNIESYIYPFIRLHEYKKNKLKNIWKRPWRWHHFQKLKNEYQCLSFIKQVLAGRKIDIVHTNTSPNDIGVILSSKLHAKHVWHVREFLDLDFHWDIYGGIPRLRKLINHADARIAISTAIKNYWQMPNDNTWVINNAIRKKSDACFEKKKDKYILFVSYFLTEHKGTRFTIEAFALSGMAKEGFRLCLMGNCDEEYYQSLRETARALGVLSNIDFIPCQADVKPYFSHATAYIMASECEAFGRVTAEAMFFGCPVIARATGGTLDFVKNEETGYLFTTQHECAEFIKKVCSEDQQDLIHKAQDYAINNLSQEVYTPKVLEVYNSIINN